MESDEKKIMSIEIDRTAIEKLTHESLEIRLRTLEQIEAKFSRAVTHGFEIEFNALELGKQLFRWFGCHPIQATTKVLHFLARLLKSNYGEEIIKKIGAKRLLIEIDKIKQILSKYEGEHEIISEIQTIINSHKAEMTSQTDQQTVSELVDQLESLSLAPDESGGDAGADLNSEYTTVIDSPRYLTLTDYELTWSRPTVTDYSALKLVAEGLMHHESKNEIIQDTLQHMQVTLNDYPPEFLLQPPHIFCKLVDLFDQVVDLDIEDNLYGVVEAFLETLQQRLMMRTKTINFALPSKKDAVKSAKIQLKVDKGMQLLLDKCLDHLQVHLQGNARYSIILWNVIKKILKICTAQRYGIDCKPIVKLTRIAEILRDPENNITVNRIKYILVVLLLHDIAKINFSYSSTMPSSELYQPLADLLHDFSFQHYFSERFEQIKSLMCRMDRAFFIQCENLSNYKLFLKTAVTKLRSISTPPVSPSRQVSNAKELIQQSPDIVPILDVLKSLKLVQMLFASIVDCNAFYVNDAVLKTQAISLLHQLMQLRDLTLRNCVYHEIADCTKKHFSCLMSGENYCAGMKNVQLLEANIMGIPLDVSIVWQIVMEYQENTSDAIKENCLSVILLHLKSEHFFTTKSWLKFLEIILPVIPLLQCCLVQSERIADIVIKLYNPDEKKMPFVAMLRGNINLLFQSDSQLRTEALTRIIYTLHSLDTSLDYVPNVLEVSDLLKPDICLLEPPRDLKRIFVSENSFNEVVDLRNLLYLLDSPDIEPLMRKSTLMQLNVICQNWNMNAALCQQKGHYLILKALEGALQRNSHADYNDAVIPTVSILVKILCYDAAFRQEVSVVPNIYILLLRALFLYPHNIEVRQDATICLFLLLYGSYLIVNGSEGTVEAPQILANIKAPLKCKLVSSVPGAILRSSLKVSPDSIAKNGSLGSYLRQAIAHYYCNEQSPTESDIKSMTQELDIAAQLKPTQLDRRLMCSTVMHRNVKSLLLHMRNATEHRSILKTAVALHLQFLLGSEVYSSKYEGAIDNAEFNSSDFYKILKRFLQLPPGNEDDFELFREILSIFEFCLESKLTILESRPLIVGLATTLRDDFNHGIITLLRNPKLPLAFYDILCKFLQRLLPATKSEDVMMPANGNSNPNFVILYINLFELIISLIEQYFELRDLKRVRCLLGLSTCLSGMSLDIPAKQMDRYCKFFKKLSITLRSSTHTGAQWHRDCLVTSLNLHNQLPNTSPEMQKYTKLSYISGLCGHADAQVRALAWCCLAEAAHLNDDNEQDDNKLIREAFLNDLAYLPGGFMSCCLSTLLDSEETVLTRQMAGNFFVMMLSSYAQMSQSVDLLHQMLKERKFFYEFNRMLTGNCILSSEIPSQYLCSEMIMATYGSSKGSKRHSLDFVCCEIVSCFCRICCKLMRLSSEFALAIRNQDFILKLHEMLKKPVTAEVVSTNPAYYTMSGDICELYALCARNNFEFLQRVLCHDEVWLSKFCSLLNAPFETDESALIKIIQLFLSLSRDDTAYEYFCEKLNKSPNTLAKLFKRVINLKKLNSPLQRCTMAFLCFLLIKSQSTDNESNTEIGPQRQSSKNFIAVIESSVDGKLVAENVKQPDLESNKENRSNNGTLDSLSMVSKTTLDNASSRSSTEKSLIENNSCSISSFLCIELFKIFTHLYSAKACKFDTPPGAKKQQVCETLSLLLKQSAQAQQTAKIIKLFEKLLQVLKNFLNEFNMNCTTFIRRFGDRRKIAVVSNFQLIFNIMLNWFSCPTAVITDELQALEFSKILIQVWPWLHHSSELQLLLLRVCAFLSEHSFIICRQFATPIASYSHTVLQLTTKVVISETQRIKPSNVQNFPVITYGLRVVMNCCVCTEGRLSLIKDHILDVFDGLYPVNPKSPRLKIEIITAWLQFWELFSRYSEGALARNLNGLCSLITNESRIPETIRLMALKILRNMCFCSTNRSQILASNDFTCTIHQIVGKKIDFSSSPGESGDTAEASAEITCEPQFIVCLSLWKLISGGIRFVSMIRGTKLAKKLLILREQLSAAQEDNPTRFQAIPYAQDLSEVLSIIFRIFQD